ncbi:glycosyltransferase [Flavobacteriaceae bacterium]|nr:glycosyltransferase [Flavobacteriaceae bacterium]
MFYCPEDIFQAGGGATVAKNILKHFKSHEKDLIIFSTRTIIPHEIESNFKTIKVWYPKSTVLRVLYDFFLAPLILLFFYRERVVCLNSLVPLFYPFRIEVFFQMRMFHFEELDTIQKKIKNILGKFSIKRCKYVYVASKDHQKDLINSLKINTNKVIVAYLGFDSELIISKNKNKLIDSNKYWVFISVFRPYKNLDGLIESYGILSKEDVQIPNLIIVGDYPKDYRNIESYKFRINKLMEKYDLKNKVNFLGLKTHPEAMSYLKYSSLFIFPTKFEGFGLPLLEAMSLGIPVICSSCHSLPEIGQDTIQYFDTNIKNDLYFKLKDYNKNGYKKNLNSALIRSKYFTWDKTCNVILENN